MFGRSSSQLVKTISSASRTLKRSSSCCTAFVDCTVAEPIEIRDPSTPLNFDLTDQQKKIQAAALQFSKEVLIPNAAKQDETAKFPWEIVKQAHVLGLMNPRIPEAYGGPGLSNVETALVNEALGYGCTGIQMAIMAPSLAVSPLLVAGTEEQKKKYLGMLAEEPIIASYCVTEPGAGSDVNGVKTKAVKKGSEYIINGSKAWISGGGYAKWFFVLARTSTDPNARAGEAFTAFIVDGDTPGISRGKKENNMGQRCSDTRTITFDDVRVPEANVLGPVGAGFKVAMAAFDRTRPGLIASAALGLHWRALEESIQYAMQRNTFGKSISQHQAVQFMIADMAMNLDLGRLATYKASMDLDNGVPSPYFSSISKCFVADKANEAATNAVQIYGGNGFNKEYPVEKLMRDAKIYQIYGGTSEIQRVVIGRQTINNFMEKGTCQRF